jgi:hypothetical protein
MPYRQSIQSSKSTMIFAVTFALMLSTPWSAADQSDSSSSENQKVRAQIAESLSTLKDLKKNDPAREALLQENYARIQSIAETFPRAEVTLNQMGEDHAGLGTPQLTKIQLNPDGIGFNAIRFQAPAQYDSYGFRWVFSIDAISSSWFIVPMDGEMSGFRTWNIIGRINFVNDQNAQHPQTLHEHRTFGRKGDNNPCKAVYEQHLPPNQIKGGQEYLIWFRFPDDQPANLYYWIDLKPQGEARPVPA